MTINQRTIHHAPECVNNFLKGWSGIACSAKEVQPVPAEKCGEVWPDFHQAHRGKVRVCERSAAMKAPVGLLSDRTVLRQQDGGALPRQVLRLPGRMRPPRLCCGIKHTKSENLPPYAPQSSGFYLLSLFSPGAYLPFPGGCGAGEKARCAPKGRIQFSHAPCKISTGRYFCVVWGAWGA